jgi:hypothetical protein
MKYAASLLLLCVTSLGACSSPPIEPVVPEVPMFGFTNTGLKYELNLTDSSVKSCIQLIAAASKLSGDRPIAQFKLFNTDSLGEKRIIATWQWVDSNGMDLDLGTLSSRPTTHSIDSQGYLTLTSPAPSTDSVSVSLRLRSN